MRKKIVAGNWKMNGTVQSTLNLLNLLKNQVSLNSDTNECVVFPPAILIPFVKELLHDSCIKWGGQNAYPQESGAFTGEISTPMLKEFGCSYVLVGHSERRHLFAENEKFVAEKYHHVKDHGMIPVLCVGETLDERLQERTEQVLTEQIKAVVEAGNKSFTGGIIAYEPVWAIGTGQTATPEQAQEMHSFIRKLVNSFCDGEGDQLTLLYGGSDNEKNAGSLFSMPDVDGGLVGGASLNAQQFVEIVKCIN